MQIEALAGAGIAAWGLWKFWPKLKGWLTVAADVVDDVVDTTPTDSTASDFAAFNQLLDRARRLESAEAQQCLRNALVPLFGGPVPKPDGGGE